MKTWNFQVKNSPEEVSRKLKSSFEGRNSFGMNLNRDKNDLLRFKIRKRVLVAMDNNSQNRIIVNGKILRANSADEADVQISFTQHPLLRLLWFGHIILGLGFLAGIFLKLNSNWYLSIVGGMLVAIGVFLWLHHQKEFSKNVREYKRLISEILEIHK